jgi:hypothetical protein
MFLKPEVINFCILWQFVGNETEIVQHMFKNAVYILFA